MIFKGTRSQSSIDNLVLLKNPIFKCKCFLISLLIENMSLSRNCDIKAETRKQFLWRFYFGKVDFTYSNMFKKGTVCLPFMLPFPLWMKSLHMSQVNWSRRKIWFIVMFPPQFFTPENLWIKLWISFFLYKYKFTDVYGTVS